MFWNNRCHVNMQVLKFIKYSPSTFQVGMDNLCPSSSHLCLWFSMVIVSSSNLQSWKGAKNALLSIALSFYRSQNVLCWSKFFVSDQKFIYILCQSQRFCTRQKYDLASVKLFLYRHKKQFYWMQIIFLSGTKYLWLPQYVNKFLVWHKKFGPAQNILGPVKGQGISTFSNCIWTLSEQQ